MPTRSAHDRLRLDDVHGLVAAATFPRRGHDHPDGAGIEAEVLPVRTDPDGSTHRLPLVEVAAISRAWAQAHRAVVATHDHPALPGFGLPDRTRVTFEPGGQLEVSGPCSPGASTATASVQEVLSELARTFAAEGAALVSAGIDLWHDVADVPQQLQAPRYTAMASYFAARSDAGAAMMRHTCSLQVNLDAGAGATCDERWLVANLVAPLATASFATSPAIPSGPVSTRAGLWRRLDRTRTGFPAGLLDGEPDPTLQMARAALEADVLLVNSGTEATPARPGWSFRDWIVDGHPDHGYPTPADLAYHLTTLFHEVRPRGSFEVRSIDALPARWRVVPVVLYTGLLYDPRARRDVLGVLESWRPRLTALLARSADVGLTDASLCAAAVETWSFAIEGAWRLGRGVVDEADIRRAEAFVDRFAMRGRCPGDDLRELFLADPAAARSWATEPVPTVSLC